MVQNYIDDGKKVGIMATEETRFKYSNAIIKSLGSRNDLYSIAHNLFKILSEFDNENVDIILSDRKSTRLNSSHANISYAVFCLKKKKTINMSYALTNSY